MAGWQECAARAGRGDLLEYEQMLKWAQEGFQSLKVAPLVDGSDNVSIR